MADPAAGVRTGRLGGKDTAFLAFLLLRASFTLAPVLFGLDKFFNWMIDWDVYLWSGFEDLLPGSGDEIMYAVGVVEILAGLLVSIRPKIGGPAVAIWLAGVVTNIVIIGFEDDVFWDIALRDFGLLMGAVALSLLAFRFEPGNRRTGGSDDAG